MGAASDFLGASDATAAKPGAAHAFLTAPDTQGVYERAHPWLRFANGLAESFARGATAGLSDKGAAVMDAGMAKATGDERPFDDIYQERLGVYRTRSDEFKAAYPSWAPGANAAGTVASAVATGPSKLAASAIGKLAQGARVGAEWGGAGGLASTNDESLGQDVKATALGAAMGAPIGAVAPVVAAGAGRLVDPLLERLNPARTSNKAVDLIANAMRQDAEAGGPSVADVAGNINSPSVSLKPTLYTAGGENTQALAGQVARTPGPGRQMLRQFMQDRDAQAGTRMVDLVNQSFDPRSAFKATQALMDQQATTAAPLYDAAYKANQQIESPAIDRILTTPAGRQALQVAATKMQNRMSLLSKPDPELTEQAHDLMEIGQMDPKEGVTGFGIGKGLKLQTLDYVKQAMDDMISTKQSAGDRGGARDIVALKNGLLKELDANDTTAVRDAQGNIVTPGAYAQGRAAYAGPAKAIDALEQGQSFRTMNPDEIADTWGTMSPSEREFFKVGVADNLRTAVAKTGRSGNEALAAGRNDYLNQQLKPLFGSVEDYEQFMKGVNENMQDYGVTSKLIRNSETAARGAQDQAGEGVMAPVTKLGASVAEGAPVSSFLNFLSLMRAMSEPGAAKPAVVNAAAPFFATTDPEVMAPVLAAAGKGPPPRMSFGNGYAPFGTPIGQVTNQAVPQLQWPWSPMGIPQMGTGQ